MPTDLESLHAAVARVIGQDSFSPTLARLKSELRESNEPFVWATIDLDALGVELPAAIKSGWIFLLRGDVPSGCHHHPNSVQHMIAVNGRGRSIVGGVSRDMPLFGDDRPVEEKWYVIGRSVPHEFFPAGEDMAVVSFHTCAANELEEVSCGTGANRLYEPATDGAPLTPPPAHR